jgi:hypothetical protein
MRKNYQHQHLVPFLPTIAQSTSRRDMPITNRRVAKENDQCDNLLHPKFKI